MGNVLNLKNKKPPFRSIEESTKIIKDDIEVARERLKEIRSMERRVVQGISSLKTVLEIFNTDNDRKQLSEIADIVVKGNKKV